MVGDAVLRIVVGTDLLRPFAGPDLRAARRRELGLLLPALELVEPCAKDAHCLLAILQLGLLVLHRNDEPSWKVRDADGGIRRVHALAARSGRAHDVDLELVVVDLDLDLFRLGHDRDGGSRGVDAPLRLGLRNALDAMCPTLELEDRERTLSFDGEDRLLDTTALALAGRQRLRLQAETLCVAREHAPQLTRPQL